MDYELDLAAAKVQRSYNPWIIALSIRTTKSRHAPV